MNDIIKAPTKIEQPIYKAEFRYDPSGTFLKSGRTGEVQDDTEIFERLRGDVLVVGKPNSWPLKELCQREQKRLPAQVEMLCEKFDLYLIEAAFSCTPAENNTFESARIGAQMMPLVEDMEAPTAYDAYPRDIYREREVLQRVRIGLDLKFAAIIAPGAEYIKEVHYNQLTPEITVAGVGTDTLIWAFRERAAFNLKNVNTFYVIAQMPVGADGMNISFPSSAKIKTYWLNNTVPTGSRRLEGGKSYKLTF